MQDLSTLEQNCSAWARRMNVSKPSLSSKMLERLLPGMNPDSRSTAIALIAGKVIKEERADVADYDISIMAMLIGKTVKGMIDGKDFVQAAKDCNADEDTCYLISHHKAYMKMLCFRMVKARLDDKAAHPMAAITPKEW